MQHFLDIEQLTTEELQGLLQQAQNFIDKPPLPLLKGRLIANLFFEPSTRTRCSFEIAAKTLGADVININVDSSSMTKGETEIDTLLNLKAMGVAGFVIRHKENGMLEKMAQALGSDCVVINAGCGTLQHPSQAMLDMLTIQQHFPDLTQLSVAIIGDMYHSRVTHSDISALALLGVKDIRLIGPKNLLPKDVANMPVHLFNNLSEGLQDVDIILTLRMHKERMDEKIVVDKESFFHQYSLTPEHLALAKSTAIVMHPGPINRNCEISSVVADGPQSVILQQAKNGVYARMAILASAFNMI